MEADNMTDLKALQEALGWIDAHEAVQKDNAEKIGSKLTPARLRIYDTIRASLSSQVEVVEAEYLKARMDHFVGSHFADDGFEDIACDVIRQFIDHIAASYPQGILIRKG